MGISTKTSRTRTGNLVGILVLAGASGAAWTAQAQPVTGLYIAGGAGVNFQQNQGVQSVNGFTLSNSTNLQSQAGAVGVLSLGWGFGNGFRAEIEGDYRYNGYSKVHFPDTTFTVGGNEQKAGPMVNVLYDFAVSPIVVPYVGVGVGYQWASEQLNSVSTGAGTITTNRSQSQGAFAYQAILGVAFPIASVPGLAITTEARFLGLAGGRPYTADDVQIKAGNEFNYAALVGIRYNFGQTPPPPPAPMAAPVAAVQPARSYLVFFDWDKSALTDRARQIIGEAASNSTHVQYTRIDVNGYTDTSGTPQYNMGLSVRRAAAVKAELIKDGVPAGAITTQGFGETHLLVPTANGVREPQNRRVEIVIH
jgi:outer membrane protein OmpA-like peptidoglycan-associated protein